MTTQQEQREPELAPAHLERAYIEQYLHGLGYTLETVQHLPAEQSKLLMRAASLYASSRLAEVETRAHLVEDIHGGGPAI